MRYLCQIVNHFVKKMTSASLRLFDKIGQPSSSSIGCIAVTLSVLLYLLLGWRTQLNKDGCLWKKKIVLPNKNCKINIKKQPFATVLTGSITGILW